MQTWRLTLHLYRAALREGWPVDSLEALRWAAEVACD